MDKTNRRGRPFRRGWREFEKGLEAYEAGDLEAALNSYERAARLGSPYAQLNLGNMYDDGEGTAPNPVQAVYWYKRAIHHGMAQAATALGISYKNQGKAHLALFWFRRASQMGDSGAKS